ncbi:hypothetical protein SERLA73DRAFT_187102 [Serpula lacrymans var. lacrymans S7.3]|uniref:Uncharacterized protein n=2 Tax=Serpula lacrymans var. lacrymans TaxID=341189 RepID=F8Q8H7_SERL3|nr:uncharacterized protein SERLADRAFT_476479 [Serpula lacrymans var. lacrymans S7.9]EGN95865.1 hypothetical protein SERLA73DRAFT_187102 [Serpula lacrymans var. lacrymans S7.3]EGO21381.1 hypothetical protein SERLADRAFT_476479 [Serpula lacrymans var. lacrymans S7.9]
MTLNIPFLFAHVLVQHLFGMEENFETSVFRHLRASLSTLPIRTKAQCHIQSERLSLKSRCKQYSCYWYRRGVHAKWSYFGADLIYKIST